MNRNIACTVRRVEEISMSRGFTYFNILINLVHLKQ